MHRKFIVLAAALVLSTSAAFAQSGASKDNPGVSQPQGKTGPINTTTGGAPASSPQGESPPGMQSNPEGSSGKSVGDSKTKKEDAKK